MDIQEIKRLRLQFQIGQNDYLKLIFEKHGSYCISNVMKKFKCPQEDAEDIMVDAIINFRDKVMKGKITHVTNIRNYIYTTCVNMMKEKSYYSKKKKEKEQEVMFSLYTDHSESIHYKEDLIQLSLQAFQKLGEQCQMILHYFYVSRCSMDEIAQELGFANANTAKVTKARCYKKWLQIIKKEKV